MSNRDHKVQDQIAGFTRTMTRRRFVRSAVASSVALAAGAILGSIPGGRTALASSTGCSFPCGHQCYNCMQPSGGLSHQPGVLPGLQRWEQLLPLHGDGLVVRWPGRRTAHLQGLQNVYGTGELRQRLRRDLWLPKPVTFLVGETSQLGMLYGC